MAKKNSGMGAGFSALFASEDDEEQESRSEKTRAKSEGQEHEAVQSVLMIPLTKIEPRAGQPRTSFDEDSLAELAESIKQHGMIQPITVRALEKGYFQIIAGERRWRAARLLKLEKVPALVKVADERQTAELALVENLQREDLNPVEEARGYEKLMSDYQLTQEDLSAAVGKSRSAVANSLRLLKLGEDVLKLLSDGTLSAGHARALLPLEKPEKQTEVAKVIQDKGLSVRETEHLVSRMLKQAEQAAEQEQETDEVVVDYIRELEHELENSLGRRVHFSERGDKGRIVLEFYNAEDREALIDELRRLGASRQTSA